MYPTARMAPLLPLTRIAPCDVGPVYHAVTAFAMPPTKTGMGTSMLSKVSSSSSSSPSSRLMPSCPREFSAKTGGMTTATTECRTHPRSRAVGAAEGGGGVIRGILVRDGVGIGGIRALRCRFRLLLQPLEAQDLAAPAAGDGARDGADK